MLNALSRFIPEEERIVTIEDTAELQLQQRHVVKFETRPPNLNKEGGINQRQLLRTALRMRPDRIIVGECRGAEALDMLQAMNTGVDGSMSTVHANTPRDAFSRLETMVMMADLEIPTRVILQQLASAIKLVVQVSRLQDGTRKILSISEVLGVRDEKVDLQEIFTFERTGVTDAGKVRRRIDALRRLLATAPTPGTNTILITHKPNIIDALGKDWFDVKEGEASLFRPENGSYKLIARVQMEEWPHITAAAK